jgi:hypothetical protein
MVFGCSRGRPGRRTTGPADRAVAQVDDETICVGDMDRQIAKQPIAIREQFQSGARRKELLDSLVRFEVLARRRKDVGMTAILRFSESPNR